MTVRLFSTLLTLATLTLLVPPAAAQDATAEVRTWSGQAFQLSQPYFEVFYTIIPASKDSGAPAAVSGGGGGGYGGGQSSSMSGSSMGMFFGSVKELAGIFAPLGAQPIDGRSRVETIVFVRDGVETRVPVERIATLAFARKPVANSTLPPYIAPTHIHYSGAAVTVDGARLDADYVNLGTMVLRGNAAQGRVDIPWTDIETLRFKW